MLRSIENTPKHVFVLERCPLHATLCYLEHYDVVGPYLICDFNASNIEGQISTVSIFAAVAAFGKRCRAQLYVTNAGLENYVRS